LKFHHTALSLFGGIGSQTPLSFSKIVVQPFSPFRAWEIVDHFNAKNQAIYPATKDPNKGNAGYRRQSLIFLDAGSESGMTGWYI